VVAGGCFMIVAAALMQRVYDPGEAPAGSEQEARTLHPAEADAAGLERARLEPRR
jgi:hypothetical protein